MPGISTSVRAVQSKLAKIAALSGDNKKIATQEVKQALAKGLITKAERDLITRAISDSANTDVKVLKTRMSRYIEAFEKADTDADGTISKKERTTAKNAVDKWSAAAASTNIPQEVKDRLKKDVITTTVTTSKGEKKQNVEFSIGSLLDKLVALNKK